MKHCYECGTALRPKECALILTILHPAQRL